MILVSIMKKPKAADPKSAIQTALLNPIKGFLDSFNNRALKFGSKLDSGLLDLLKNKIKDDTVILMPV